MSKRDCLRCGTRIHGHDTACTACGASWPRLSMLDGTSDQQIDEAVVWVLGAMITIVAFFLLFVAW